MTESFMMIGKTAVLFLFTLFCFRLMGYRSLGDMEPLDYVVVLGIGEIMGSPLSGEASMIRPMVAIATLTALQIILSSLYSKMPKVGKVMEGGPVPVIRNGKLIKKNLLIHRIDQAAVMEELRIKGLRDEKDVDIANLEPSGRFSVILKNEAAPITPRFLVLKGQNIWWNTERSKRKYGKSCPLTKEPYWNFYGKTAWRIGAKSTPSHIGMANFIWKERKIRLF